VKRTRRTTPKWSYNAERGVMYVEGSDFMPDLRAAKRVVQSGRVPFLVNSVVYQSRWLPKTPLIISGHVLSEWLIAEWAYPLWNFIAQPDPNSKEAA